MSQSPRPVTGHPVVVLARLNKVAWVLARVLAIVGLLILLGYAFMNLADGALRSLAGHPINAVRDLGGLVAAVAVACCMPLAFLERSNITVRLCGQLFGQRVSHILDAIAAVVVTVVMGATAWRVFLHAFKLGMAHETTFMLFVPVAPFWFTVAATMLMTCLVQGLIAAIDLATCCDIDHNLNGRRGSEL